MNKYLLIYLIALTLLNLYLLIKVDILTKKHNIFVKAITQGFEDISSWINRITKGKNNE